MSSISCFDGGLFRRNRRSSFDLLVTTMTSHHIGQHHARLDETYASVRRGIERAEQDPEQWPTVAKFAQAEGSLIDTGLRAAVVLAGGAETAIRVRVDHLVILPATDAEPKPVIDVTAEDKGLTG
jgi:hypothetical protein